MGKKAADLVKLILASAKNDDDELREGCLQVSLIRLSNDERQTDVLF